MIPVRLKSTEDVIKAHLTGMYSTFGGNKYILSHKGNKFTSKQLTWLANELSFIKLYTSPYLPAGKSVIEWTHAFLKGSLRKIICNHNIDWDEILHIGTMAYNVFPHISAGEAPLYLMFGCDAFMPTLFELLLPKLRYIGDEKCRIHLYAMPEIYMMAILILKIARDKCPPQLEIQARQISK